MKLNSIYNKKQLQKNVVYVNSLTKAQKFSKIIIYLNQVTKVQLHETLTVSTLAVSLHNWYTNLLTLAKFSSFFLFHNLFTQTSQHFMSPLFG